MTGAAGPRTPPLWLLVLITFSGTVAMHIFMPALPAAALSLDASAGAMQMTISLYILGLAAGQPIYGPLSDCYGRRPVLMVGLALFVAGGLLALWAPNLHVLATARFFQALGGCAGLVLGRAIVRDTSGTTQSVRRLALINLVLTIGPGLAPMLGQTVADLAGWRYIFALLAAFGMVNMLLTWRILPETGQPSGQLSAAGLRRDYGRLLGSRTFLCVAIGGGCATTAMYAYMAAAPFIFVNQLHRPAHEVAVYLGVMIIGAAVGSLLTSRLAGRITVERLMTGANALSVACTVLLLVAVLAGFLTWQLLLGAMLVYTLGAGMAGPAALTRAISVDPRMVGSAAGLYGMVQMVVGALCTSLAGLGSNPALSVCVVLLLAGMVSQGLFRLAFRAAAASD